MDAVAAPYSTKVLKVANSVDKQAACKQAAVRKTKCCKSTTLNPCPRSNGCARASINGWEWHRWSLNASPAERARIRGIKYVTADYLGSDVNTPQWSNSKGLSARTNRAKLRNLLAAAEGADLLKTTQLKVITMNLDLKCFYTLFENCNLSLLVLDRRGKNAYVSSGARYTIGVLLPWSQLRRRTLLLNMLEN